LAAALERRLAHLALREGLAALALGLVICGVTLTLRTIPRGTIAPRNTQLPIITNRDSVGRKWDAVAI